MNAFLKTCEEPLSNRYILATAEHESWILPTILSRAMVIKFWSLSDAQMEEYVSKNFTNINWEDKKVLVELAMWSPWTFHSIYTQMQEDGELLNDIQTLLSLMKSKWKWTKKVQLLKKMEEKWLFDSILNVLIKEYTEEWNTQGVDARIRVKKLIASNVNQENALWDGVLTMDK
jgi:replication-associated recombination protein RarA